MASTYITRTVGATATDVDKCTLSFWLKRTELNSEQSICGGYVDDNNRFKIRFLGDNKIDFEVGIGGTWYSLITNRKFVDTTAWYHMVFAYDSSQGTDSNRLKMWVNGVQETSFSTANYVPQNSDFYFIKNTVGITVGDNYQNGSHQNFFDGLMSHFHCIDGTAYTASDFGEVDSTTGEWKIITGPNVTYGNNGFFILKDGNTITDDSPNSNNWSSGGGTLTKTQDNPSNNFALLNRVVYNQCTMSNGSNTAAAAGWMGIPASMGLSEGKWYWEYKNSVQTNWSQNGIMSSKPNGGYDSVYSTYVGNNSGGLALNSGNGDFYHDGSSGAYSTSAWFPGMVAGDIISVALDVDASKIWFARNGTWGNSSDPAAGTNGIDFSGDADFTSYKPYFPCFSGNAVTCQYNFGNGYFGTTAISSAGTNASNLGLFEYDVPTGFKAICTKGLNS